MMGDLKVSLIDDNLLYFVPCCLVSTPIVKVEFAYSVEQHRFQIFKKLGVKFYDLFL